MMLIVQLTDTHLFADPDQTLAGFVTARSLAAVVQQIQQLATPPDLALLTGDLSQDETVASYQVLHQIVQPLAIPTYWLPGNHDRRSAMQVGLAASPLVEQRYLQRQGWQIFLLDSQVPGKVGGWVSPETLDWLEQQLTAVAWPALIALHHPPIVPNERWQAIGLENGPEFCDRLAVFPQVKLVLFGHIHQEFQQRRQHITYLGAPSTCVQYDQPDDLPEDAPSRQPGARLVKLLPNGEWQSWIVRISDPSVFRSDPLTGAVG